jgi:CDP-diacylglycerol--serine O-phosphatidyltransferase
MSNAPNDGAANRRLNLLRKRIAILPTLCTLANAACGLAAIVFAARFNVAEGFPRETALYISGWLIYAAMVFDLFDGFIARRTKTASNFGAELDSLCDGISFGAAPAFLLLQLGAVFEDRKIKELFLLVAMLYMMCALLRLARFNVQTDLDAKSHRVFRGLPSPAAAGALASLVVLHYNFTDPRLAPDAVVNPVINVVAPVGALVVALLMVSPVPYVHAANRILHRRFNFSRLVQFMLVVFALVLLREFALVIGFWSYALWGPVRMLLVQAGLTRLPGSSETNETAPAAATSTPPSPPSPHVHRVG